MNMMMKKLDKKTLMFKINLATSQDGSFQCPKCGLSISPDDDSEENYQILDTKLVKGELVELIVCCGKCRSAIEVSI
jgi:hypothetical protein